MHDLGVLVGGSVIAKDSIQTRSRLFQIYRLLNLIHTLLYWDTTPEFNNMSFKDLVSLGLLTEYEHRRFRPYDGLNADGSKKDVKTKDKSRDMAISWLDHELTMLLHDKIIHDSHGVAISRGVAGLRGVCARHHDLFVRDSPNVYLSTMSMVVDFLIITIFTEVPFVSCIYVRGQHMPLQVVTICCTFIMLSAIILAQALAYILRDPFLSKHAEDDVYSQTGMKLDNLIDCRALLHSTDCCIFAQLRANFDRPQPADSLTYAVVNPIPQTDTISNDYVDQFLQENP